ncbi:tetratricopeptide repeat protein [Chitinophaga caseinilytica]|uniref:tetratricopeptide repeat protein n=1 Tax=Chitinophaga caseinilytica TaxID=2267521 RepID=UPI003C2EC034
MKSPSTMEEYTYTPEAPPATSVTCSHCGSPHVEHGHASALCPECRQAFINYPIPRWLWIFAGVVAMVLVINLLKLPASIKLAGHLIRAERAVDEHNFLTAQHEADSVLTAFPEHFEAHCYHLIASAYNFDYDAYDRSISFLGEKTYIKEGLVVSCNAATDYLNRHFCEDTLLLAQLDLVTAQPPREQLRFIDSLAGSKQTHAVLAYCGARIGSFLLEHEQLPESRAILEKTLDANPDHYFASIDYATVLRKMNELEKADSVCDILLERNHQDSYAMSAKSRVVLRKKQLPAAEELAMEAVRLDPLSSHALASLALVLEAKGQKADSRQLLQAVVKLSAEREDTASAPQLRRVLDGETVYQ